MSDEFDQIFGPLESRSNANGSESSMRSPVSFNSKNPFLQRHLSGSSENVTQRALPESPQSVGSRLGGYFSTGETSRQSYTDLEIQDISRHLLEGGRKTWSEVPRLYIVLRTIGQLHLLDSTIDQGITDIWFPFSLNSAPKVLSSSLQADFIETQSLVLTKAVELERSDEKKHAHFGKGELFPFEQKEILGSGGFGTVDKIYSSFSKREYARKRFVRPRGSGKGEIQSFRTELQVLKRIHHHHCVELVASYTDLKYFGIIMSPVADYNMYIFYQLAADNEDMRSWIPEFFGCLANGLSYLHKSKIRHRDIKPENILIKGQCVYLADFGISLDWQALSRSTTTADSAKSWIYCAPEVAEYQKRNSSADIWSLGCIFLEMFTVLRGRTVADLRLYFKKKSDNYRFYANIEPMQEWLTSELEEPDGSLMNSPGEWILAMTSVNAEERPTAEDLVTSICKIMKPTNKHRALYCGECCMPEIDGQSSVESFVDGADGWVDELEETSPPITDTSLEMISPKGKEVAREAPKERNIPLRLASDKGDLKANVLATVQPKATNEAAKSAQSSSHMENMDEVAAEEQMIFEVQSTAEWPTLALKDSLPKLSPESWKTPTNFLHAIQEDFQFLGVLAVKHPDCFKLVSNATMTDITTMLHMLIHGGLDINDVKYRVIEGDQAGATPLMCILGWPVTYRCTVELLLDSGADLVGLKSGLTPLMRATRYHAIGIMEKLFQLHDAKTMLCQNSNYFPEYGSDMKAIHYAGSVETVRCLLAHGADISAKTTDGFTLFKLACKNGQCPIIEYLLDNHRNEINIDEPAIVKTTGSSYKFSPVSIAASNGHLEAAKLLVRHGADVATFGKFTFFFACSRGHMEVVKYLIENHRSAIYINEMYRDISGTKTYPLISASHNGHVEIVKLLMAHGANISAKYSEDHTAFHRACSSGHEQAVRYFLENHSYLIDLNQLCLGCSPLYDSCLKGHTGIVKLLLEYDADPNLRTSQSMGSSTPLHIAAWKGHLEIVKLLLQYGAKVAMKNGLTTRLIGDTPIDKAKRWGHLEIVQILKKAKGEQARKKKK